jgi:hypothetical protein
MAPVIISSTGIPRQTIDSPELISLIERLSTFDPIKSNNAHSSDDSAGMDIDKDYAVSEKYGDSPPLDIDGFVAELKKCQQWRFQEQVSLCVRLVTDQFTTANCTIINNFNPSIPSRPIFTNGRIH